MSIKDYPREKLLSEINALFDADNYGGILDLLEDEVADLDYELSLWLVRTYINANNCRMCEGDEYFLRANAVLDKFAMSGKDDPYYQFYKAYVLYKLNLLDDAVIRLERSLKVANVMRDGEIFARAQKLLANCRNLLAKPASRALDLQALYAREAHVKEHFGQYEILFKTDRYEILHVSPTEEHPFHVLITSGLSNKEMEVPEGYDHGENARLELVLTLPYRWTFASGGDFYIWPVQMLCDIANYVLDEAEYLGFGFSFNNDAPLSPHTKFTGGMLTALGNYPDEAQSAILPDGSQINFFEIILLRPFELKFREQHKAAELIELFVRHDTPLSPFNDNRPDLAQSLL